MSWISVALGTAAVGSGIYKAVQGNQTKQRNKGYIENEFQSSKKRLLRHQDNVRTGTMEALNQRGLSGGSSQIAQAMMPPDWKRAWDQAAPVNAPHTLGDQQRADNETQFNLEQKDLVDQRDRAETENKIDYANTLVSAGVGTVQGVLGAMNAGAEAGAARKPSAVTWDGTGNPADASRPGAQGTSRLAGAMTGVDDPRNWFRGIVGHNPTGAPGSAWNRGGVYSGEGMSNMDFHVDEGDD